MPIAPFGTRKIIITCALTGGSKYNRDHPSFPITPKEIADSAIEAARAGAAIVHVHVRDPATGAASYDVDLFKEASDRIRQSAVDVILNLTCGGNARFVPDPEDESRAALGTTVAPPEIRYAHIEACRPDIASLDVTTSNQGDGGDEYVYLNTPRTLRAMAKRFKELGVKPEIEVFEGGDIGFAHQLIAEGLIPEDPIFQFVLGVKWNAPATPDTVAYMKGLLPERAHWGALGTGRNQYPIAAQSVLLGGNIRVGLEDNLYLQRGVFASNGQLVERARQLINILGHEPATPKEARDILGLHAKCATAARPVTEFGVTKV
ncbi:MAG: 3-keto-5-aminohexanoate cleavage protein, partial [Mesorhizobium sp.]